LRKKNIYTRGKPLGVERLSPCVCLLRAMKYIRFSLNEFPCILTPVVSIACNEHNLFSSRAIADKRIGRVNTSNSGSFMC